MPDIGDIRAALAENIKTIASADDFQIVPYMKANPTTPMVWLFPGPIDYDEAGSRGLDKLTLIVQAFGSTQANAEAGQRRLDKLLAPAGADSMKAAIESDATLGGLVDDLRVTECGGLQTYTFAGGEFVGYEWMVEVYAEGIE